MPPPATPPRDSCIIAVTGIMNPSVHSPQFYRTIGVIDEDELQASLKMPLSITPMLSQFRFDAITVSCHPTQWWIETTNGESWERMIAIATRVFTQLGGTPVSGFTLAVQRHIDTGVNVKPVIAQKIATLDLGFPSGTSSASSIELAITEEDYTAGSIMQPSVLGEQLLYLLYQREYQLSVATPGTLPQVGASIQNRLEKFLLGSNQYFDAGVSAIRGSEKEGV
jgi:hypothetical protein